MEPNIKWESDVLHNQARVVVDNIYKFMEKEACEGPVLMKRVQERVSKATGISIRTVQRILKEARDNEEQWRLFSTPYRKRTRKKKSGIDDLRKCVMRQIVNEFYHTEGHHPNMKTLLSVMKDRINFEGSLYNLRCIINKLGFRWKKSSDKCRILIEKSDIREKRLSYLYALEQYKKEGRPVIYTYETYIRPYTIIHAASGKGFICNTLLIFESDAKFEGQHNTVTSAAYEHWLKGRLIPNLPPKSILVLDNRSQYYAIVHSAPTSSSRKADMIKWLMQHNIPFDDEMFKPELHRLINLHKSKFTVFKVDAWLAQHGHSVLQIPPCHADLNPLEKVWAIIRDFVAERNANIIFNELVEEKLKWIAEEQWISIYNSTQDTVKNYLLTEPAIDKATEGIMNDTPSDNSGSSDDSDGDGDMNSVHRTRVQYQYSVGVVM